MTETKNARLSRAQAYTKETPALRVLPGGNQVDGLPPA